MRSKFINENTSLSISNDESVFDIQFTTLLKIKQLILNNCKNVQLIRKTVSLQIDYNGFVRNNPDVKLIRSPTQLTVLKINNCKITNLAGIEQYVGLTELDVQNNKIVSIKEIKNLSLNKIIIEHNIIFDMKVLTGMKNYNTDWVQEQDEATDQDYVNYIKQTGLNIDLKQFKESIQQEKKESQQLIEKYERRYEKDMIVKYQKNVVNNSLCVQNDDQIINLNFADDLDVTNLTVDNCKNVKFVKVPVKVTSLVINNCNITNIDGVEAIKQLKSIEFVNIPVKSIKPVFSLINITSLRINNTQISNIAGIEALKQLTSVDLRNNAIILIEQLKQLSNLKQVLVDNNYIQDLEYLSNQEWISQQQSATDANLQAYLTDTNSTLTLDAFKAQIAPKKAKSDQLIAQLQVKLDNNLCNKYQPATKCQTLYIENDNTIKDLKFAEQLDLVEIILSKCVNVTFRRPPSNLQYLSLCDCNISDLSGLQNFTQLKKLQITNSPLRSLSHISSLVNLLSLQITGSKLTNIVGIGSLSKLQYLELSDNQIISIQPLQQLLQTKQFKQLHVDNNFIVDLEWLVVNYSECICRHRTASEQDYQNYIQDANLNINVAQLKSNFAVQISKSAQLIQDFVVKYESEMKAKFQGNVNTNNPNGYGDRLEIYNDPLVRDLKFVEEWGVTHLYLEGCPNARNFPRNLKRLSHYSANLKSVKFAERLTNLERLQLYSGNEIVNVNGLRALTKLKHLDLDNQRMNDLSAIDYLKAKGTLMNMEIEFNKMYRSQVSRKSTKPGCGEINYKFFISLQLHFVTTQFIQHILYIQTMFTSIHSNRQKQFVE
ncbi:Conserved_hypothetical protein [Hexamita inflata]|uniref:Uncharacterized protein n=1 Tax=Hexamita inflata TaxID=28002 RepID=A0AA86TQL8_9EUKA|nr:Conserved hypothetical protein [Hexamita inflata]